jgi:spore germination protein KC
MLKRILVFSLLILFLLNLTGCGNRIEPEQYAWVTWIGLDRAAEGKIQVTVAVTPPLSPVPTGVAPPEKLLMVSTATGDTLFDAIREINSHMPKRLFWPYLQTVIISDDLASEGVDQYLDLLFRNGRFRKNSWVFITKGSTNSFFKVNPQIEKNPSTLINSLVKAEQGFLGKSRVIRLKDFQRELGEPGVDPVVSVLGIWDTDEKKLLTPGAKVPENSELALDGSAVFRGDKLVGWLSPEESQAYLLMKGEMKTGLIVVPHPDNPQNKAGIEVNSDSATLKSEIVGDQIKAHVTIKIKGNLGDQALNIPGQKAEKPNEQPEFYLKLDEALENKIKSDAEELLAKSQTGFNSDILGIGNYLWYRYPNDWEKIQSNGSDYYKKVAIEVEVNVDIAAPNIMRSQPPNEKDELTNTGQ